MVLYSRSELIADAVIHIVGVSLGVAACIALFSAAWPGGEPLLDIALGAYAAGLLSMLGFSALYNLTDGLRGADALKEWLRRFDHAAIFLMIAGTYTPFSLIVIGGAWGTGLLIFVWAVALAGMAMKLFQPRRLKWFSVTLYLLLGWSAIVAIDPLLASISLSGIVLLFAGGLLYSVGVIFHLWERLPYQNAIWHAFVLAAAICHYAAVYGEVIVRA